MGTEIALIFGSVCYDTWDFLRPLRGSCTVICADGGVKCAEAAGFQTDVYVGDSDSGGAPPRGAEAVLLRPEKDLTDLQAAYEYALARGFQTVILTACTGGRQDHHLANLQLLETAAAHGVSMRILDPWNEIRYLDGGQTALDCRGFRYFSVIPLDRELRDVQIQHAKYPLCAPQVRRGDSLTVSNEPLDAPAEIKIGRGAAWIILSQRIK